MEHEVCKYCKLDFQYLLKHLSQVAKCKAAYSEPEYEQLEKIALSLRNAKRRARRAGRKSSKQNSKPKILNSVEPSKNTSMSSIAGPSKADGKAEDNSGIEKWTQYRKELKERSKMLEELWNESEKTDDTKVEKRQPSPDLYTIFNRKLDSLDQFHKFDSRNQTNFNESFNQMQELVEKVAKPNKRN